MLQGAHRAARRHALATDPLYALRSSTVLVLVFLDVFTLWAAGIVLGLAGSVDGVRYVLAGNSGPLPLRVSLIAGCLSGGGLLLLALVAHLLWGRNTLRPVRAGRAQWMLGATVFGILLGAGAELASMPSEGELVSAAAAEVEAGWCFPFSNATEARAPAALARARFWLEDPDCSIRFLAASELYRIDPRDPAARRALRDSVRDLEERVGREGGPDSLGEESVGRFDGGVSNLNRACRTPDWWQWGLTREKLAPGGSFWQWWSERVREGRFGGREE